MVKKIEAAVVKLWDEKVGAVAWLDDHNYAIFEYDQTFLSKGLDISPIHMSLDDARTGNRKFTFPTLNKDTFLGLPGLLADALPDKFGNNIIDAWLARNGRDSASFSPIERLCYTGKRSIGALEFSPAIIDGYEKAVPVEISELVDLAQTVMNEHSSLQANLGASEKENANAIIDILRVGTSAGGARPKAVIAMNDDGNIISGQAKVPQGYDYWILKFDGVTDLELGEPRGYGRIEYAYYLMALAAGIEMTQCRLLEENGRAHFMTRRFDRIEGKKLHMLSLCGIAHYDFNSPGTYGYEQVFAIMRKLHLHKFEAVEQYRRILFNIIARNQDDHTKNIAFLMQPDGKWKLSPAFDVTYSHNPAGKWTNQHQMSLNGKRAHFTREDLIAVGESIGLTKIDNIINDVVSAVSRWPEFAKQAGIRKKVASEIANFHRLNLQ